MGYRNPFHAEVPAIWAFLVSSFQSYATIGSQFRDIKRTPVALLALFCKWVYPSMIVSYCQILISQISDSEILSRCDKRWRVGFGEAEDWLDAAWW